MGCRPTYQGTRLVMDCPTCGLGLTTPQCINSHLRVTSQLPKQWKSMRYEEEVVIDLDEDKSAILQEYDGIIRQVEAIMLNPKTYGRPEDDYYLQRKKALKDFYDYLYMNPLVAARVLKDYNEPYPQKAVFVEGYRSFQAWMNGILAAYTKSSMYQLCVKTGDLRAAFLALLGLKTLLFMQNFMLTVPKEAVPLTSPEANYELGSNLRVKIYDIPGGEAHLYTIENLLIENLPKELQEMLKVAIQDGLKETRQVVDFSTIFDDRSREFAQKFIDQCALDKVDISQEQAVAMGREAASWVVGLGAPIENIALDRDNITDIYIDSENSPIYLEHAKFGLCHTLWRYNHEMLENAFRNIVVVGQGNRKFDKTTPVIDLVLTRLAMRCHLQRPPATFGDLQAALRIMRDQPFTYPMYLKLNSLSPFFAGYDDVMVGLGCSEAVLGLKGVGKTAFTSAKIAAIGTKKRILPIQDIEEIPTKAYRKRGFHIGAVQVQSSDKEESGGGSNELDLVSMTNAALRMGDACVIINEIRSRLAIQGVINMLNTQPGIFLLYNLHAQSLKDVQDRLELVFGVPAASMYSTDRYSFLKKIRFGRKSRVYRMLGLQYETDLKERKFVEVFHLERGEEIGSTNLKCLFLDLPEASAQSLTNADLGKIAKNLKLAFVPPALERRSDETGISPQQYTMEAFFKGKMYSQIHDASVKYKHPHFLELDFVLECGTAANNMLKKIEEQGAEADWSATDKEWQKQFKALVEKELKETQEDGALASQPEEDSSAGAASAQSGKEEKSGKKIKKKHD
ncbi:MAG: ATPase, T2SS/T4P/T4SS family [Candidatus Micrarchaeota archaeon]|nr:ATPase, T2SS/T4P/T4SS family [Candidatus Micrarchaeota archaeon]